MPARDITAELSRLAADIGSSGFFDSLLINQRHADDYRRHRRACAECATAVAEACVVQRALYIRHASARRGLNHPQDGCL